MHAGFGALRRELPLNCRARRPVSPSAEARADLARVVDIWRDCRERHRARGPWLFGEFSPADAMYAPVALRFLTYGVEAPGRAAEYVQAVAADPAIRDWIAAAEAEPEAIAATDEVGVPA
jgi:glutathione S-transferase